MPPEFFDKAAQGLQYFGPNLASSLDRQQQADQFQLQRQDSKDRQQVDDMRANQQMQLAERQAKLQEVLAALQGQQAQAQASFQQAQLAADERRQAFGEQQAIEDRQFRRDSERSDRLFKEKSLQATKDEGALTREFQSKESAKAREASAEQRDLDRAEEARVRASESLSRLRDNVMLSNTQHAQELEKLRMQIDANAANDFQQGVRNLDGLMRSSGRSEQEIRTALRGFAKSHLAGARLAKALGEKAASTSAFDPGTIVTRLAEVQKQAQEAAQRAPDGLKAISDATDVLVNGHDALVKELSAGPGAATKAASAVGSVGATGLKLLFGKGGAPKATDDVEAEALIKGVFGESAPDIVSEVDAAIQSDARAAAPAKVAKVLELGYTRAQVNNLWKNLAHDYKAFNTTLDDLIEARSTPGKSMLRLGLGMPASRGLADIQRIEGIMNLQTDVR